MIDGDKTNLYVEEGSNFLQPDLPDFIFGTLRQNEKITLARCLIPEEPGYSFGGSSKPLYFANIFPHYVIRGDHFDPNKALVKTISFRIDDAEVIFPDTQAFGQLAKPKTEIAALLDNQTQKTTGERPEIFYYLGNDEIFQCTVPTGNFYARHGVRLNLPNVTGFKLDSSINLQFKFEENKNLFKSLETVRSIARLFGLLAGRPQHISNVRIELAADNENKRPLTVLSTTTPTISDRNRGENPSFRGALISGVEHPNAMAKIIFSWLSDETKLGHARHRFFDSFDQQYKFDINRIIAVTNLYDLIPEDINPVSKNLPQDVQSVVDKCKELFNALPDSPERSAGLSSLGRMNSANLKKKIFSWSENLRTSFDGKFERLKFVTDQAVDCRNHFVHGSPAKFNYHKHTNHYIFLIQTLEFTFALSYLIRIGWSEEMWETRGGYMHYFNTYLRNFDRNFNDLCKLLG